ncbi:MAG: V-type ATP synthase subunit E [bacterium]
MGFSELKERILSDARKEADEIIKEANIKASSILEEASLEVEVIKTSGLRSIQRDTDTIKRQALANAKLRIERSILNEVQKAIEEIANKALEEVINNSKYLEYLTEGILSLKLKGDEEIILSSYDIERFKKPLEEALTRRYKKENQIKISIGDIYGGFIVRGKEYDINNSLEVILEDLKPEIEELIGDILKEAGYGVI